MICLLGMPWRPTDRRYCLAQPAELVDDARVVSPRTSEVRRCAVTLNDRLVDDVPERIIARPPGRGDVPVTDGLGYGEYTPGRRSAARCLT